MATTPEREARLQDRKPTEHYPVISALADRCSHGVDLVKNPDHNCREFENAKRAKRGAPPL